MTMAETIRTKLEAAFAPEMLDVRDESEMHRGHAGHREGGETHFRVAIVSAAFEGLSRVDRHRKVHAVLDAELKTQVHALALTLLTPDEAAHRM
jgi:BolA family transcriptional regulator, general stress-responsive regulator